MNSFPNQSFLNEEDEDLLYSYINDKIEDILGDDVSQSEKQKLLDSIYSFFIKHIKNIILQGIDDRNQGFFSPSFNQFFNPQVPFINLYLPPNFGNIPSYNYPQQPPIVIPGALQPPIYQPQQLYQQPNVLMYNQSYPQSSINSPSTPKSTNTKGKSKKHKKSNKHEKEKHHKKDKKSHSEKVDSQKVSTFEHDPDHEFQGIIRHLADDPHNKSSLLITSSSTFDGSMQKKNVLIFNNDRSYFSSNDIRDSWICFDFTKFRVTPTYYTIKSIPYPTNNYHPKSWVIEASEDQTNWETLDSQVECQHLNGNCRVYTFQMKNKSKKKFRFVRMRQTDKNCGGSFYLEINNFELYGKLYQT